MITAANWKEPDEILELKTMITEMKISLDLQSYLKYYK